SRTALNPIGHLASDALFAGFSHCSTLFRSSLNDVGAVAQVRDEPPSEPDVFFQLDAVDDFVLGGNLHGGNLHGLGLLLADALLNLREPSRDFPLGVRRLEE